MCRSLCVVIILLSRPHLVRLVLPGGGVSGVHLATTTQHFNNNIRLNLSHNNYRYYSHKLLLLRVLIYTVMPEHNVRGRPTSCNSAAEERWRVTCIAQ